MLDEAFRLLNYHLGHLHVPCRRFVEGGGDHFAFHRALHVGDFLGTLVDQQNDEITLRVIGSDRLGNVLQDHGLAGTRLGGDQRALALALRRHDVDYAPRLVFDGGIVDFHVEPLGRIKRRQIVKMNLVLRLLGILKIDRGNLQQCKITFAVLGAPDWTIDGIARSQSKASDLRRRHIDVVGAGQIVRLRRAQEPETILQRLEHTAAHDLDVAVGEFFEDRKQHVLLAHGRRILDIEFFGEGEKIGR